jgi:hypothetical protein
MDARNPSAAVALEGTWRGLSIVTGDCSGDEPGASLAAGSSCAISVTFSHLGRSSLSAPLNLARSFNDAPCSPSSVAMAAVGAAASAPVSFFIQESTRDQTVAAGNSCFVSVIHAPQSARMNTGRRFIHQSPAERAKRQRSGGGF